MKGIPVDEKEVIRLYVEDKWTLRMIAERFLTDHHRITKILRKNNIEITRRKTLKEYTDEHRRKVGLASLGRRTFGIKKKKIALYKNMVAHLKYNITLEWAMQFEDIDKLKFLNKSISRQRDCIGFTDEIYIKFVEKFYYDAQFNIIYERWITTRDKWARPSLDHIHAKSCGGKTNDLENLQFLTWFENRTKCNIPSEEWEVIKKNIKDYLL